MNNDSGLLRKIAAFVKSAISHGANEGENERSQDDPSQEIRWEVVCMVNRFTSAIQKKNVAELEVHMTNDIVLLTPSGDPIVGRDVVKALCSRIFSKFNICKHTDFAVKTSDERTTVIVHAHHFIGLTSVNGGVVVEWRGSVVAVLRYENGQWKVARILSLVSGPRVEM